MTAVLILPGAKLNAPCATRRVNYKDVIYNLAATGDRLLFSDLDRTVSILERRLLDVETEIRQGGFRG